MKRRDLKADAVSMRHLLTHKPKNPYCESCVRGKMLNIKKFKGAFSKYRDPQKKFDLVTGDYIQGREDSILAVTGDRNAFVIKDLWSCTFILPLTGMLTPP